MKKSSESTYRWRKKYPEKWKAYCKSWRAKNKDKIRSYKKKDYQNRNKKQYTEKKKEWRRNNPDKVRNSQLRQRYKINLNQYNILVGHQNGVCAICGEMQINKSFHIDHNHDNGRIRGLLCTSCNLFLGMVERNRDKIDKMRQYLEKDGKDIEEILKLAKLGDQLEMKLEDQCAY